MLWNKIMSRNEIIPRHEIFIVQYMEWNFVVAWDYAKEWNYSANVLLNFTWKCQDSTPCAMHSFSFIRNPAKRTFIIKLNSENCANHLCMHIRVNVKKWLHVFEFTYFRLDWTPKERVSFMDMILLDVLKLWTIVQEELVLLLCNLF